MGKYLFNPLHNVRVMGVKIGSVKTRVVGNENHTIISRIHPKYSLLKDLKKPQCVE